MKIQMNHKEGSTYKELFPISKEDIILNERGETLNNATVYQSEIDFIKDYDSISKTNYTIVYIPTYTKLKRGFPADSPNSGVTETASEFFRRKNSGVIMNASIFDVATNRLIGRQINDGNIILDEYVENRYTFTIDVDGNMGYAHPSITATTLLSNNIKTAITGFIPLIENGVKVSENILNEYTRKDEPHPRQTIGQKYDGTTVIITCEGRFGSSKGMGANDLIRIGLNKGLKNLFMLDGGGSASTLFMGTPIVRSSEKYGKEERRLPDFLYLEPKHTNKRERELIKISKLLNVIGLDINGVGNGEFDGGTIRINAPDGFAFPGIDVYVGDERVGKLNMRDGYISYSDTKEGGTVFAFDKRNNVKQIFGKNLGELLDKVEPISNANNVTKTGLYWMNNNTVNRPVTEPMLSWGLLHFQIGSDSLQIAFPFHASNGSIMNRRTGGNDNGWTGWAER